MFIFKKSSLKHAELIGKIDRNKEYSLADIAGLFYVDIRTVQKWHDPGIRDHRNNETYHLEIQGDGCSVHGMDLLRFIDRVHLYKGLSDRKYHMLLGSACTIWILLFFSLALLKQGFPLIIALLLIGITVIITIMADHEIKLGNLARINFGWNAVLDFVFEQKMISIRPPELVKPICENRYGRLLLLGAGLILLIWGIMGLLQ
jgi:hypothetical protein